MARKKSRVPTPPRGGVQAPRKRVDPRDPRRTRLWLLVAGAVVVFAAAAVGIAMAVGGGEDGGAAGADGVCVRETFPDQGRAHVRELEEGFEYNSTPPTSGPHALVPAIWNVYDRPVPQLNLVHNLEHGGIVVQYGEGVPARTVQDIIGWYQSDPNGIVVAPLPELGSDIALTAWTHLAICSTFDDEAFSDFRDDYRGPNGDAPEKFPVEQLEPGGT